MMEPTITATTIIRPTTGMTQLPAGASASGRAMISSGEATSGSAGASRGPANGGSAGGNPAMTASGAGPSPGGSRGPESSVVGSSILTSIPILASLPGGLACPRFAAFDLRPGPGIAPGGGPLLAEDDQQALVSRYRQGELQRVYQFAAQAGDGFLLMLQFGAALGTLHGDQVAAAAQQGQAQ